jgi:hypothetical protein
MNGSVRQERDFRIEDDPRREDIAFLNARIYEDSASTA